MEKLNQILEKYVITFWLRDEFGYMVGFVDKEAYFKNPDHHQEHVTGETLEKVCDEIMKTGYQPLPKIY